MSGKIFLHLLILCGIWSQGIIETFADEEIEELSGFLVRQKRVVSYLPGEDIPVRITDAPYTVCIKELKRSRCVGSILSPVVVITSAECVSMQPEHYQVFHSASRLGDGTFKNVTEIRRRIDESQRRSSDGVALLIVTQQFLFTIACQPISLHTGPVIIGSFGKFYGWGYNFRNRFDRGTQFSRQLRSIEVPVISHQDCVNRYRHHFMISERTFCTYHPERHSGHTDFGAGIIINGTLAGVFLWSGVFSQTDPQFPDVFAYLHDPYFNQWIRINLETIDLRYRREHQN